MIYNKQQIQDAAKFSNFAQKFKVMMWGIQVENERGHYHLPEGELDRIALELWDYLNLTMTSEVEEVKPVRVQRSRQHKMVSPNGLPIIYVGRPSKWGNPYFINSNRTAKQSVEMYQSYLDERFEEMIKNELKGKNLACWCPLDQPCHADILLEIANK